MYNVTYTRYVDRPTVLQGGPEKKATEESSLNCLPITLDFFIKLKCQSSILIVSIAIKYFMRDLCDVNYTVREVRSCDVSYL